jgi:hypothetical protein
MSLARCAIENSCRPIPVKLGLTPTRLTLRLEESPLLRFFLSFDARGRPDLWPLEAELARVRDAFPELTMIQLDVDDEVELKLLLTVVDFCVGAGFPTVIVAPDAAPQDVSRFME